LKIEFFKFKIYKYLNTTVEQISKNYKFNATVTVTIGLHFYA